MFTRCPECLTVHSLNASLLAHASGTVSCGHCKKEFNALAFLFDHWPDSDSIPPSAGVDAAPPMLGKAGAYGGGDKTISTAPPAVEMKKTEAADPLVWKFVFIILLVITVLNTAWTFREPLIENARVRSHLVGAGLLEPVQAKPFRDVSLLHLVSRDMHQHPTRAGTLALSVTFVNRADRAQPYPDIEVILSDSANAPLARRVFSPLEYLPQGSSTSRGLAPDVHVLALLEFADPGSSAVGFELNFH